VFASPETIEALVPYLPSSTFVPTPGASLLRRQLYVQTRFDRVARARGAKVIYCPGSLAPLRGHLPTVLCIQNPHLFTAEAPRGASWVMRRILGWLSALRATSVVHISESMAEQFRQTTALRAPIRVVLSGAGSLPSLPDSEAVDEPAARQGRPYVLAVSNLSDYKRMDLVVSAYGSTPELRDRYDLVIAGNDTNTGSARELRNRARAVGLRDDQVRFTGFVGGATLERLYERASLYVSASEREAFPLTPAEALVAGIPVVLSDIPPFRELYQDWATLFHSGDVVSLGMAMTHGISRGSRPYQVEEVRARFSWTKNASELLEVLSEAEGVGRPRLMPMLRRVRPSKLGALFGTLLGAPVYER
jgi:glycosyltransferase involved in cell wall biosynthesis